MMHNVASDGAFSGINPHLHTDADALLVARWVKSMTSDPLGEGGGLSGEGTLLPVQDEGGSVCGSLSLSVWLVVPGPRSPPSLTLACTPPHLLFNGLIKSYFTAGRSCQMT